MDTPASLQPNPRAIALSFASSELPASLERHTVSHVRTEPVVVAHSIHARRSDAFHSVRGTRVARVYVRRAPADARGAVRDGRTRAGARVHAARSVRDHFAPVALHGAAAGIERMHVELSLAWDPPGALNCVLTRYELRRRTLRTCCEPYERCSFCQLKSVNR